jgi:hypothetical protein
MWDSQIYVTASPPPSSPVEIRADIHPQEMLWHENRNRNIEYRQDRERRRNEEFLDSTKWLDPDWKGLKVLGQGGRGLVGLWEQEGGWPKWPKRVVIKQTLGSELDRERKVMLWMGGEANRHVVRLLGTEKDRPARKIMLEYCGGEDLQTLIQKRRKT